MQLALIALAVMTSTAWLAVDASKRDWTGNAFARNVPSWVVGALLLWPLVMPMYVFVQRKKAPLRIGAGGTEAAIEIEPPAFAAETGANVEIGPKPPTEIEPEPVMQIEIEPAPEPEPVIEFQPRAGEAPVFDVSRAAFAPRPASNVPAEAAPPGLSVDAFKDIKPVAFGGAATEPPAPESDPEPIDREPMIAEPETQPEPVAAAVVAESAAVTAVKPRRRLPGPQLRLPTISFDLPPNLRGPLTALERRIALGSAIAIVAAAAFGYSSAPVSGETGPSGAPAPPTASR